MIATQAMEAGEQSKIVEVLADVDYWIYLIDRIATLDAIKTISNAVVTNVTNSSVRLTDIELIKFRGEIIEWKAFLGNL